MSGYKYSFKSYEIKRCLNCPCSRVDTWGNLVNDMICKEQMKIIDVDPFTAIPTWCRLEKEEVKEEE
jgi:hypothetical protein